jgi:hypothetical protein
MAAFDRSCSEFADLGPESAQEPSPNKAKEAEKEARGPFDADAFTSICLGIAALVAAAGLIFVVVVAFMRSL